MSKGQRIVTIALWAVLITVLTGVIGMGVWDKLRGEEVSLKVLFPAPKFALINQDNKPVTSADLHGHPWIAAFIFTTCATECPMMTDKMASLQKAIRDPSVKLVSFTVNPEHDTPEVLKQYAARFNADASRWYFLTGTPQQITDVAEGMKMALQRQPHDSQNPVLHSTRFLLVDADGMIRGVYDTKSAAGENTLERLSSDADALAKGAGRGK